MECTESITGKEIKEIIGVVTGNVVQAKHIGLDIMSRLKSIVGGEIKGYTEMLTEARDTAVQRLVANTHEKKKLMQLSEFVLRPVPLWMDHPRLWFLTQR